MMRSVLACVGLGLAPVARSEVYFAETFHDGWEKRWTQSVAKHEHGEGQGTWGHGAGEYYHNLTDDRGLETMDDMKWYGISAQFPSFTNAGKNLVIQFSVKMQKENVCGGGYIKIGPKLDDYTVLNNKSPYNIMFGPDKCGTNSATKVVFAHQGVNIPKKKEIQYAHDKPGLTHVYRLTLKPDNTVRVEIDDVESFYGNLTSEWEILKASQLIDPNDNKPADWVASSVFNDPNDLKPDDWVDVKRIRNMKARKPENWDDDEDGEWEVPMMDNPAYKGAWNPRVIGNPAYKGFWNPRKIPNPEYVKDDNPYLFRDFSWVGFDLWQLNAGMIFDNIVICNKRAEADRYMKKYHHLHHAERVGVSLKFHEERAAATKKAGLPDDDEEDLIDEEADARGGEM